RAAHSWGCLHASPSLLDSKFGHRWREGTNHISSSLRQIWVDDGYGVHFCIFRPFPDQGASTVTLHSAKLKRLAPSVNCGSNQMTLSVKRRGTHHFLIDTGEEPLTPLSQVPSTCGFFVKRSRRDVQYAVSYQGYFVLTFIKKGQPYFSENQKMPENQNSPLLPNFFLFPGSESPAHPTRDGNAHTSQHQLPQTPLSQYPVPLFQEFPMMSGVFLPTTTPLPLPATSAEAIVTTPAPTGSEKPSLQPEFPALFQYPFPSFSKYPQSPQEQTADDADFKPQYLHPQVFQIPMFYPFNHLSQLQNAPAPVAFTDPPPSEKPLYQQHRFIPVYVVPNPILPIAGIGLRNPPVIAGGFLNPPAMTSSHLVPSSQQEHQHFYHAMQPFYPFLSDQSQTAPTNI
uniref:Uncharacterized LOC102233679 n=1 Tax=Xiphophorus maculatus TaxID=8083 RepID=A0A3B5Q1Q4_XIPMA